MEEHQRVFSLNRSHRWNEADSQLLTSREHAVLFRVSLHFSCLCFTARKAALLFSGGRGSRGSVHHPRSQPCAARRRPRLSHARRTTPRRGRRARRAHARAAGKSLRRAGRDVERCGSRHDRVPAGLKAAQPEGCARALPRSAHWTGIRPIWCRAETVRKCHAPRWRQSSFAAKLRSFQSTQSTAWVLR